MRAKEYESLLQIYYESVSKTMKLLGSNPNQLFTFENLETEMKRCGKFVLLLGPLVLELALAESDDVIVSNDAMSDENKSFAFTNGLNEKSQSMYESRLKDIVEDVIRLGYFESKENMRQNDY